MIPIPAPEIEPELLARIEATAVDLARIGGQEIMAALGGILAVKYKGEASETNLHRDPVSEVDGRVERLIRERIATEFLGHDVIGEEMEERPGLGHDFVWAVDPIDGTSNFINGFPLFASSVGVLWRGRPVAGALWCSTSHLLTTGIYHCGAGEGLKFEGQPVSSIANPAVRRRLAGEPDMGSFPAPWDSRKTGSAAIECAFVAVGLLRLSRFNRPNIWDVAGGMALAAATGATILEKGESGWRPFSYFGEDGEDMAHWRRGLIMGDREACLLMADRLDARANSAPSQDAGPKNESAPLPK